MITDTEARRIASVVVTVRGGVAEVESYPEGITVEIRDYDNCEYCDGDECPDYCEDDV